VSELNEDQLTDKRAVEHGKWLNKVMSQEVRRKILDYVTNVKGVKPSER